MLESFLRQRSFLYVTFVAFVGLRLAVILLVPAADPFSDAGWYVSRAIELVEHGSYSENGVPTAFWPVGYPAFLSFVFKLSGTSLLAARLANLALAAMTFWFLYAFTLRTLDDELTARGAVFLLTIYPNNIAYVSLLLSETLYTALLLGAVTLLLLSRKSSFMLIAAGAAFGLATLVKAQTLLVFPVLTFLATLEKWTAGRIVPAVAKTLMVGLICLLTILPWSFRNLIVLGNFVLVSTNGGMSLLAGNNSSMSMDWRSDYAGEDPAFALANFSVKDQVAADKRARALALEWIQSNPGRFVALIPKKIFRLWAPDGEGEWGFQDTPFYKMHETLFRGVRLANQAFYAAALVLFFFAALKLSRLPQPPKAYLGIAYIFMSTIICIFFSGQSRYHFPAMPFVFVYASWFLVARTLHATNREARNAGALSRP